VADRKDDQVPDPAGRATCTECGNPLAPDQRYCLNCGARRGRLPGAVASTLGAIGAKGKGIAAAAAAKGSKASGGAADGGDGEKGGWSWMPSPPAIAIAVIGMLALGVGLGSAMSEVASSAPISTLILEYPHHAAAPEEPEEEVEEAPEEETFPEAPEESAPEETFEALPPEEVIGPLPEEAIEEPQSEGEEPNPLKESIEATEREQEEREQEEAEEALPEIKHAFLIVLGENSYESTYGTTAEAPYLSRVLPGKGELLPNYYGVTGGVLANEIAMLSGQGPTAETLVNCPNYTAIAPGTVSETAEQVEGTGCVYGKEVESLPTQLEEKGLTWRAYVESMEAGAELGIPTTCRKPTLGGPDTSPTPVPGDQYATWRNPVLYFSAIAESEECGKLDVGFEKLEKDLKYPKQTPALSLIFPNACHAGGETECEPGAPKGAQGATQLLKTLVPAIMASPAYEEGGMILITSAQAPQAGDNADPSGCCLAPSYPNLVAAGIQPAATPPSTATTEASTTETSTSPTSTTEAASELEEEAEPTKYTEESVLGSGGGGKVGLLMISPYVEAGKVEETEYANHFTLLKSLEKMFGVEPLGFATEEQMPTLSPSLFRTAKEVEAEAAEKAEKEKAAAKKSKGTGTSKRAAFDLERAFSRLLRSPGGSPGPAARRRGTS